MRAKWKRNLPSPEETRAFLSEKLVGVERVANALGDGPSKHHRCVEGARPSLRVSLCDTPNHEETRSDLNRSSSNRAPYPANGSVNDLENGERLNESNDRADKGVRVGSTLEDVGDTFREEVRVGLDNADLDKAEAGEHISGKLYRTRVRLWAKSEVLDECREDDDPAEEGEEVEEDEVVADGSRKATLHWLSGSRSGGRRGRSRRRSIAPGSFWRHGEQACNESRLWSSRWWMDSSSNKEAEDSSIRTQRTDVLDPQIELTQNPQCRNLHIGSCFFGFRTFSHEFMLHLRLLV